MNGNTEEPRAGGLIHPARLTDILFDDLTEQRTRYAAGGIIVPGGAVPAAPAGNDHVVIGFDVGFHGDGVIVVRPIEGGDWGILGTMMEGLQAEAPAPPSAEEITATVNDFMARFFPRAEQPDEADEDESDAGRPTVPIEDQIDRAIAGLCPCGGPRREPSEELPDGSPYCSYDCEPNHTSVHTDPREIGPLATPSRWRPDLVSAVNDAGLVSVRERQRRGQFWAEIFERAGTDQLHLRLDDDVRFVGADVPRGEGAEHDERCARKWAALERELTDGNRTMAAAERDEEIRYLYAIARMQQLLRARERAHQAEMVLGRMGRMAQGQSRAVDIWPQHIHWALDPGAGQRLMAGISQATEPIRRMAQIVAEGAARSMARFGFSPATVEPDENPRERALRLRQERNTGPQPQQRAPRRIDARGSR